MDGPGMAVKDEKASEAIFTIHREKWIDHEMAVYDLRTGDHHMVDAVDHMKAHAIPYGNLIPVRPAPDQVDRAVLALYHILDPEGVDAPKLQGAMGFAGKLEIIARSIGGTGCVESQSGVTLLEHIFPRLDGDGVEVVQGDENDCQKYKLPHGILLLHLCLTLKRPIILPQ